jgi:hypothetical protein
MITLLAEQLYAFAMMAFIMFLPAWAIGRLVEIQLSVPKIMLPAAWFTFGLALWSIAVIPSLAFGWTWRVALISYAIVTFILVVIARELSRRHGQAKPRGGDVAMWTVAGIVITVLLAELFRTRMAFDSVFHLGMIRRLELVHPTFSTVDRILGSGVNPSYAMPSWQMAIAAVAGVTGLDPATVLEAMAAFCVFIAACAAAGLGRMISGRWAGEIAGVAAYAWLRVFFPRRELEGDGVAYAALPGNICLDTLLPLILAAVLVVAMVGAGSPTRRRGGIVLGIVATALFVVLHANYLAYLVLIGGGALLWMLAARRLRGEHGTRMLRATLIVVVPAVIAIIGMLPVLTKLEQFGSPLAVRIDYHTIGHGAWRIIRPGHLYDWFAAPGLLAMVTLPFAVRKLRGVAQAIVGGGALVMLAVSLVPPLFHLLDATGSRTIGIRIPRPFGVLLGASLAAAIPAGIEWLRAARANARGRAVSWALLVVPFLALIIVSALYRYPRAHEDPPQYGWNWPTIVAVAGLIAVLILVVRERRRPLAADASPFGQADAVQPPGGGRTMMALTGLTVLALAICMLPSGFYSLRRGAWQSRELVASYRADDLACFSGVQNELRKVHPGATLLADPVTGYTAQALAPVHILADYKLWNGKTSGSDASERIEELRKLFDAKRPSTAARQLDRLARRYHARYLLVSAGDRQPPDGSTMSNFDARGLREALHDSTEATLLASGQGGVKDDATDDERRVCDLSLYEVSPGTHSVASASAAPASRKDDA